MSSEDDKTHRWVIGVGVAFLAAIVPILVIYLPKPNGGASSDGGASSAPSRAQVSSTSIPATTGSSPSMDSHAILWQGPIRITDQGVDLAQNPPGPFHGGAFATLQFDSYHHVLSTANSPAGAPWTGAANPSYQDCINALATEPFTSQETRAITYTKDSGLCVKAFNGGNVGFFRLTAPFNDSSAQTYAIQWAP